MRNLKKILALVLALVMSLSLMATAGAASFQDVTDDNPYKTAIDVLDQLKVFQGFEDGSFKPTDTLNRAQAAVLVYRIATGDVEGKQVENYTYMAQSKFVDLDGYNWAKGYINYCQNAKIVVGTDATHFAPGAKVTGYQLMVMLLRTLGYGAAGEFTDPKGWELETAKIAEREGILKNVTGGDFGAAAPRQMVAEILFRGLLSETVTYSALTSGGYTKTGETLGKRELSLEELEGVVMANEYASLTSSVTAKDGKTELLSDGKTYTLNTTTTLDDIGENRHAYIQGSTVLYMENVGNNVWEDVDGKKDTDSGITINSTTERFTNFADGNVYDTSDYLIRYVISETLESTVHMSNANAAADVKAANDADLKDKWGYENWTYTPVKDGSNQAKNEAGDQWLWNASYTVTIKAKTTITSKQLDEIHGIFNGADTKHDYEDSKEYIDGEVYVGTQSYKDISDELSFDGFVEKYLNTHEKAIDNSKNDKGNWLKVIDNDGDGVAEYVFKVIYTIAQVSKVKDDAYTLDVKNHTLWNEDVWPYEECDIDALNTLTSQKVIANGDMETGSVVYYAIIDGKAQAYPTTVVPSVNIEKYVRKTETVTTTDGDDYIKSDVCEHIEDEAYDAAPELLAGKVNYDLFLVRGNYLGAFVKSEITSDYKLITDGWFDSRKNADEYAVRVYDEESERADKQEIVDITTNGGLFIDRDVWNVDHTVDNNDWGALKYLGGVDARTGARSDLPANNDGTFKHTCAAPGESKVINGAALNGGQLLCETDASGNSEHWFIKGGNNYNVIKTTVAAITADGTILPVEDLSVTGRYRHSMIDLMVELDDGSTQVAVPTRAAVNGTIYYTDGDTAYDEEGSSNVTVRATSSTVYYVVYPAATDSGVMVTKSVGYSKAPDLKDWNKNGWIEDIYAVGTLRTADNDIDDDKSEYTADVVVIELNDYENDKEIVLVLDDAVKLSDTRYRDLVVITASGKLETRTVRWNTSYVGTKQVNPGLWYMSATSEKDIYALQGQLDNDDIAEVGGYTTGRVERVNWTNDRYVVIDPYFWSGSDSLAGTRAGEDQFDLTAETPLFRVSYDDPTRYDTYGTANVDEGVGADWDEDFLSAAVDVVNKSYPKAALVRDTNDGDIHNARYYNYNRVLIHHDGKGNVVYAVSFDKLADESGINNDNYTDVDMYNYAMTVWNNVKPAPAKNTDTVLHFNLTATGTEGITVKNNAEDDGTHYGVGETPELVIPKAAADKGIVRFCILEDASTTLAAVVPDNPDWTVTEMKRDTENAKLWNIMLTYKDAGQLSNAKAADTTATIWTVSAVTEKIEAVSALEVEDASTLSTEQVAELETLKALLTEIEESSVPGYTVQDTIDTIETKLDAKQEADDAAAAAEAAAKTEALDAIKEDAIKAVTDMSAILKLGATEAQKVEVDNALNAAKQAIVALTIASVEGTEGNYTCPAANEIVASAFADVTPSATPDEEALADSWLKEHTDPLVTTVNFKATACVKAHTPSEGDPSDGAVPTITMVMSGTIDKVWSYADAKGDDADAGLVALIGEYWESGVDNFLAAKEITENSQFALIPFLAPNGAVGLMCLVKDNVKTPVAKPYAAQGVWLDFDGVDTLVWSAE